MQTWKISEGKKNLENQFGIQKPGLQAALIPRFQAIFTAKDWLQHRWPGFFFWWRNHNGCMYRCKKHSPEANIAYLISPCLTGDTSSLGSIFFCYLSVPECRCSYTLPKTKQIAPGNGGSPERKGSSSNQFHAGCIIHLTYTIINQIKNPSAYNH